MTRHTPLVCSAPLWPFAVGTGGIGSGVFFLLEGNHTLTRNESRLGRQLNCRDYCKQHIILHYLAVLMGAATGAFEVWPVGVVGDDDRGWGLLAEMDGVGMATRGVTVTKEAATLFSVCFQYPDSTGGNITSSNGASALMTAEKVKTFLRAFRAKGRGIALAAPEVPLEVRLALLEEGRSRGWFTAASFAAGETAVFTARGGLELTDLLSLNRDEAAALAGLDPEAADTADIVKGCCGMFARRNGAGMLIVTDGPRGAWACAGGRTAFAPPLAVENPASTAGAGDALFAGVLAGLTCGLPFVKDADDSAFGATPLDSAIELGTLLASLKLTSADTIHWDADAVSLKSHADARGIAFSGRFAALFPPEGG